MKQQHLTILLTGGGTATTLSIIKGLRIQKEFSVRIIACDRNDNVSGHFMVDQFYKIPSAEKNNFISTIRAIVKKENVQMIIPVVDYEFHKFAEAKKAFLKLGCTVVLSDIETIRTCTDKFETMKFFDALGLPHPKSFHADEIRKVSHTYPLFIKPSLFGRATIDSYMLSDKKDLEYYLTKIPSPIIQEYIQGTEVTVDVLCDFKGKFIAALPRVRTETKSGLSIKGIVFNDKKLIAQIKRIAETLPILGPANIQCFKRGSTYIFSEINPRFSGAHSLSIQAGLNSAHVLCKLFTGQQVAPDQIRITEGIRMIRYWEEIFIYPDTTAFQPSYTLVRKQ